MSRDLEPRSVIGATNNESPTRNSSSQFSASSASGSIHHNGRIRGAPEIVIIDHYYFIAVFSSKSIIGTWMYTQCTHLTFGPQWRLGTVEESRYPREL